MVLLQFTYLCVANKQRIINKTNQNKKKKREKLWKLQNVSCHAVKLNQSTKMLKNQFNFGKDYTLSSNKIKIKKLKKKSKKNEHFTVCVLHCT